MNPPTHPHSEPLQPPSAHDPAKESKVGTPLRLLSLCLGSLAVMAPWPLLGIMLMHTKFDEASEAFLFFGGITLFPVLLIAIFVTVSKAVTIVLVALVWLAAAVVPDVWLRRRLRSWTAVTVLLTVQSAFSLAQALMGALLIVGKSV